MREHKPRRQAPASQGFIPSYPLTSRNAGHPTPPCSRGTIHRQHSNSPSRAAIPPATPRSSRAPSPIAPIAPKVRQARRPSVGLSTEDTVLANELRSLTDVVPIAYERATTCRRSKFEGWVRDISDMPGDRCRTGRLAQGGQPFGAEARHAPAAARLGPNQRSPAWRASQEPNQSCRSLFSSNFSYRALWFPCAASPDRPRNYQQAWGTSSRCGALDLY